MTAIPDIEALAQRVVYGYEPDLVEFAIEVGERAFIEWARLPDGERGSAEGWILTAMRRRVCDALRRDRKQTVLDLLADDIPLRDLGRLPPGEAAVLRLRRKGRTRVAVARALGLTVKQVRCRETSALHGLGRTVNTINAAKKKLIPVWAKADRASTMALSGRVLRLADMPPEKQAEMRRLYETEPNRKRAAGQCPETGCGEPRYSALTGRCVRHHARWPGAGERRRLDRLLAKLAADAAAANQPTSAAAEEAA